MFNVHVCAHVSYLTDYLFSIGFVFNVPTIYRKKLMKINPSNAEYSLP